MQEAWVISLLEQCQKAGVPFFFKQWGGVQKKRHGRLLNGRPYDEQPSRTAIRVTSNRKKLLIDW